MKLEFKDCKANEVIKLIRKDANLTQLDFAKKLNKPKDWVTTKEINKNRITINDFIFIINKFNFNVEFHSIENGSVISLNNFKPNEIIYLMRDTTGKSQKEFASAIKRTRGWQYLNEVGKTIYYANDLFDLALRHNFKIIIRKQK